MTVDARLRALLELEPRSVDRVLDDLVTLRRRAVEGQSVRVPLVTFHMKSGRDLSGWIIERAPGSDGALLVHAAGPNPHHPHDDAIYLHPSSVEALTVHAAGGLSMEPPRTEPPPSRLALNRRSATVAEILSEKLGRPIAVAIKWEHVPEGGEPLWGISDMLEHAAAAISEIAADEMGRAALDEIATLELRAGDRPAVALTVGKLVVAGPLTGPEHRLDRPALKQAIEAAL